MVSRIQALLNQYQQKYPLYTMDNIVELMLDDGVITSDIAKKIKSGVSLFMIDNELLSQKKDNNFSMTEIMGGYFTPQKTQPSTNFNRKIEPTFQSEKQGDCWLLSDINALNTTEWGKQAIFDAINPKTDGSVTIKFKGSPIEQKEFNITAQEIEDAKNSGYYSSGDDDMIALELATEKLSEILVKKGLANRITNFDELTEHESYIAGGGVYFNDGHTLNISELITGQKDVEISYEEDAKVSNVVMKYMSDNKGRTASVCTFVNDNIIIRESNEPIHGNHAYAVKEIAYGKYAIVIDPFHTDETIKLSWQYFTKNLENLYISPQNTEIKDDLEELIPETIKNQRKEAYKEAAELNDNVAAHHNGQNIYENIFPNVADMLINFGFKTEDVMFDKINVSVIDDYDGHINYGNDDFELSYSVLKFEKSKKAPEEPTTKIVNKDNVILLLDIKPDFIEFLDNYKSGWGKGKEKKALIMPIINALVQKAEEQEISSEIIENFKKKCLKELDAKIYTNEKVIIEEVNKLKDLIKND